MENKNPPGGYASPAELIRDTNLLGRPIAKGGTERSPYAHAERFKELAEKISKGDRALADTLLRRWGVLPK